MFSLLQRYRDPLLVGALLLVPLVTYLTRGHRGREPNVLDRLVLALSSPVQSALTWGIAKGGGAFDGYVGLRGAHQEALACRVELSVAHAELNALNEAKKENERLKALLAYREGTAEQEVVARIIGLNPSAQFLSVRINRGEDDGVRVGMPVVTPDGVVGQVIRAVGASADVMLVTDPASRIGGLVQRSRVRGSIAGTGDGKELSFNLVRREDDVRDGDVLVTAGTDGVFPSGLMVGTVHTVTRPPGGMFLTGRVEPAVDLGRVEEVLVVPLTLTLPSLGVKDGVR